VVLGLLAGLATLRLRRGPRRAGRAIAAAWAASLVLVLGLEWGHDALFGFRASGPAPAAAAPRFDPSNHGGALARWEALVKGAGLGVRGVYWKVGIAAFEDHPLAGAGALGFAGEYFARSPSLAQSGAAPVEMYAHNAAIQLLAETGLAGFALVLAALALWTLGTAGRAARRAGRPTGGASAARTAAGLRSLLDMGLVLLAFSLTEFPLWYASFLGVGAILLGLGAAPRLRLPALRPLLATAAAAGLCVAAAAALDDIRLHRAWRHPEDPASREDLAALHGSLLAPFSDLYLVRTLPDDRVASLDADEAAAWLALARRSFAFLPNPETLRRLLRYAAAAGDQALIERLRDRVMARQPELLPRLDRDLAGLRAELAARRPRGASATSAQ